MLFSAVLLLLSFLSPFATADDADSVLFTSSLSYCKAPESLLIDRFDLTYFAANESIFFNISAASVAKNVSVNANIVLQAYGLGLVNITVDLCDLLGGALCPLPMYHFAGSQTISLPQTLGVSKRIPKIAFQIPDLEAFAQLTLVEVGTGKVKACVQATLSNGLSVHQPAVPLATGIVLLLVLVGSIWQTTRRAPSPPLPHRLLDLFHLFQFIATTGLLSLNHPLLYRAFTLNFAYVLGLVSNPRIQAAIDNMRARTGGHMANSTADSAVALVDRKLSPYSNNLQIPTVQSLFADYSAAVPQTYSVSRVALDGVQQLATSAGEVQTVTDDSNNVLQAGIPIFVNSIHIGSANALSTVFLVGLMVIAVALTVVAALFGARFLADRYELSNAETRCRWKFSYPAFVRAWVLRVALAGLTPIYIFAFYQWTLKDSWLSVFLSVIAFLAITASVVYPTYTTLQLVRRESTDALEVQAGQPTMHAPLYERFRPVRYYFFLVSLAAAFVRAIVIATGQGHGQSQVVVCLIIEVAVVVAHVVLKPYLKRGGDILSTYLAVVRLVCTGLLLAFVEALDVGAIPRVAIGAVIAVISSIAVLVVVGNIVVHSGGRLIWRKLRGRQSEQAPTEPSTLEKGDRYHGSTRFLCFFLVETCGTSLCMESARDDSKGSPLEMDEVQKFPSGDDAEVHSVHSTEYKLYRRRFIGITGLVILNIAGGLSWPWFGPIATPMVDEFGFNLDQVNWLGNIVATLYLPVSLLVPGLIRRYGIRRTCDLGAIMLVLSAWIRYAGTIHGLSRGGAYALIFLGQVFAAIAQPIYQVLGPKYSETWFDLKGRVTATMVLAIANPVGGALGQLMSPIVGTTRQSILILGIVATAAAPFVFLISAAPPTPPTYAASKQTPGLLSLLRAVANKGRESDPPMRGRERIDFVIIACVFGVLSSSVNVFGILTGQILQPVGYSSDTAGFVGAVLLLSGIVAAIVTSPLFDRVFTNHLAITAKCLVPVVACTWLSLIWAVRPNNTATIYALGAIIGIASVTMLPVGLELAVETTRNADGSSALLFFMCNALSVVFVLVEGALRAGPDANPPLNMRKALIFNGAVVLTVCSSIFFLRGEQTRKAIDREKLEMSQARRLPAAPSVSV
ncbi:MFS general substrate transporter [Mycena kentingensis (nom. inval.)]|nr:MFS general substrate transporter [Mycena kentingensis (nom. inval.)]